MDELCDDDEVQVYNNKDLKYVEEWDYTSEQAAIEQLAKTPMIESVYDGVPGEIIE